MKKPSESSLKSPTVCKDGTAISIQASAYHYCSPKMNGAAHYSKFELNLLDKDKKRIKLPSLKKHDDDCVYAYVPAELVQELINSFGGLASSPWQQFK